MSEQQNKKNQKLGEKDMPTTPTVPYEQVEVERMAIPTTVQKWGNSLAVRIPSNLAEVIKIQQGSEMEWKLSEKEGIALVPKKKKYTLEELLAQCTPENRHEEVDFGGKMGREEW